LETQHVEQKSNKTRQTLIFFFLVNITGRWALVGKVHDQLKLFNMQVFGGVDSGYEFTLYGITFRSHVKKPISVPIKNAIFRGIIATERRCFAQLLKVVYISYRLGGLFGMV
jgi:hypothetical protein